MHERITTQIVFTFHDNYKYSLLILVKKKLHNRN
jgi:hypothetical protein